MREFLTANEMVAIEENAVYLGVSLVQLMECAGQAVAKETSTRVPPSSACVVVSGTGRNGGDGMVAARHLAGMGYKVQLILIGPEEKIVDESTRTNWNALRAMATSVSVTIARDSSLMPEIKGDVIIDAVLGTGAKGKIEPPTSTAIEKINRALGLKIAVDIPSGIDATTGEVLGEAVAADLTVTLHKSKTGLAKAKKLSGKVVVANIGVPPEAELYAGPGDVQPIRRKRAPTSHKGDFGRILIIGGNETFVGAPTFAALAAIQTGADLVYVAAPEKTAQIIASFTPNLITVPLTARHLVRDDLKVLKPYMEKAAVVIFGMGLGLHPDSIDATRSFLEELLHLEKPVVLDADGLKAFGEAKMKGNRRWVLTPHPGEYEILTGQKPSSSLEERIEDTQLTAKRLDCSLLLKGATDIITDGEKVKLNLTGNPGMTVGGTGDTLAGLVGGFIGLGAEPYSAAVAGSFVNGAAGDFVVARKGYHLTPMDIIEEIPAVIDNPMKHRELGLRSKPI